MSRESEQLHALANEEWRRLGTHVQKLPGRTGDALSAFAGKHPVWTTAGAAALTVWFMSRRRRRLGPAAAGGSSRLPAALAAIGAQMLPELLKLLALMNDCDVSVSPSPNVQFRRGPMLMPLNLLLLRPLVLRNPVSWPAGSQASSTTGKSRSVASWT